MSPCQNAQIETTAAMKAKSEGRKRGLKAVGMSTVNTTENRNKRRPQKTEFSLFYGSTRLRVVLFNHCWISIGICSRF
jgi:hypothetical protein